MKLPLSPHVDFILWGWEAEELLTLLAQLTFYLILGNCWWAKVAGTLKHYAALNKIEKTKHSEQSNGNDSSLIISVWLCSNSDVQLTMLRALTKRAKGNLLTLLYKYTCWSNALLPLLVSENSPGKRSPVPPPPRFSSRTLLQQLFRRCAGFRCVTVLKETNLRLVYKSLKDLALRSMADLFAQCKMNRALRSSAAS